jgi:hypothetical protein
MQLAKSESVVATTIQWRSQVTICDILISMTLTDSLTPAGMLDIVEMELPLGQYDWDNVSAQYNSGLATALDKRDSESLKRKFISLKNNPKPTGD